MSVKDLVEQIHSESAKVKFISVMPHTIMPKLVAQLSKVSTDEHNLDVVITQVFLDHE